MFENAWINKAHRVLDTHKAEVSRIFEEYRGTVAKYGAHYAPEYATQKKAEATADAAAKIAQADRNMCESLKEATSEARLYLRRGALARPEQDFANRLKLYNDFGIKMSESEIRAYAGELGNSVLGMKMLQKIAEKSGFRLCSGLALDTAEADVKRVEAFIRTPSMYAPVEYAEEAAAVLGEIPYFRNDGSVYHRSGAVDAAYLCNVDQKYTRLMDDLHGSIAERWSELNPLVIEMIADDATEGERSAIAAENNARRDTYAASVDVSCCGDNEAAIASANEKSAARAADIRSKYIKQ